jgi:hypothetical protein
VFLAVGVDDPASFGGLRPGGVPGCSGGVGRCCLLGGGDVEGVRLCSPVSGV